MAARLSATLLRTQTDRRLVALASQGSEPAFEALVERYRKPLQSYCRRMLLPAEAAEDVVQQAFLSTWTALRRGTDVRDARAWLYRVTHNAAVNALTRSGYGHDQLDDALRGAGAPEEDLERRIAVRRTLAGLAELPEMQREALLRTAVEGQSHEEVARELGVTDGAVRGLVYRARVTLRAAATALTPAPVAQWAAAAGGSPSAPLAERVAEVVAGSGTAGAGALLVKGGVAVLTAGALAGGAVVVDREGDGRAKADAPAAAERAQGRAVSGGGPAASSGVEDREAPGGAADGSGERRGRGAGATRERGGSRRSGRSGDDDRRRGSSRPSAGGLGTSGSGDGPGRAGSGSSGRDDDDDDDDRSGSSGSGSGGGDDDRSGSSGSGSSGSGRDGDEDSSGSGSGSSGPGSGGDSSGRGSGSSGSGSSGGDGGDSSGSGSSGSGGEVDSSGSGSGSSGSGSSGSGSDDSSGSGSSGSGSGDSSGSGSSGSGSHDDAGAVTTPDEE